MAIMEAPVPPGTSDGEAQRPPEQEWQPTGHEKAIIYTLAMTSFIVALDAPLVIPPLSVSSLFYPLMAIP